MQQYPQPSTVKDEEYPWFVEAFEMDKAALTFFEDLSGRYEWHSDPYRLKSATVLEALIEFYRYDDYISSRMIELYASALEDTRIGRGEAELENLRFDSKRREQRERRQEAAKLGWQRRRNRQEWEQAQQEWEQAQQEWEQAQQEWEPLAAE
jgi:hypothetical protein